MEIIKHTTEWVNGEVLQGKIMVGIAVLLLVAWIAIFKSQHEMLRGALIPLGLMVVALGGYGSYQVVSRPNHVAKVQELAQSNPLEALQAEEAKAAKDHKAYSNLKIVWMALIVVSVILNFLWKADFSKGLGMGLIALFLTLLALDSTLHHRLQHYMSALSQL